MSKENITEVTAEDLNGIDFMNGQGNVSKKGQTVNVAFKGALAKYNGTFSQYDEILFIRNILDQLYEYQTERFIYKGLPKGLTKYRLESKLIENGSAVFVKINDNYVVANYSVDTFNMYNEPVIVRITEPKSPILNGKVVDLRSDLGHLIRNNERRTTILTKAQRYIKSMEKVLFQIEKNITSSAPKGIINLKNADIEFNEVNQAPVKNSMEQMINGQDTFYALRSKSIDDYDATGDNNEEIFIPIELTDRTESLIQNYTFLKENLKELVGASLNVHQKKERAIQDEISGQQGFSTSARQHAYNIRLNDIEEVNEKFGLSISIEYQPDVTPEEVEENNKKEEE